MVNKQFFLRVFLFISLLVFIFPARTFAQSNQKEEIIVGKVTGIVEEGVDESFGTKNIFQRVNVEILSGEQKGKTVQIHHGKRYTVTPEQKVAIGEKVVISQIISGDSDEKVNSIVDKYRMDRLLLFIFLFFIVVLFLSKWKGLGSIIGLGISFATIVLFLVPQIVEGKDPIFITICASLFIMASTMFLAHGFSKKTVIALASTFISLVLTAIISAVFVSVGKLSGLGSEEAYSLILSNIPFEYKGLFLAGMIIGALGVLDDVTTGQTAAIFELSSVNERLTVRDLIKSGLVIGREHISSLVNTLVLAYAGASLPIFLFFAINPQNQPLWFLFNSEFIAEEIVRTLSGSFGLVLAVPITTMLAAWYVKRSG